MSLALDDLRDLPSPFYRVAAKVIIFDDQRRILTVVKHDGNTELPGGGWEHDETLEDCLQREAREEIGVGLKNISPIWFTFRGTSSHGWQALRLVVRAELADTNITHGDDMREARFVTKNELLAMEFLDSADAKIKEYVDVIWSEK